MNDQRIKARPTLCFKDLGDCNRIQGIGRKSVNSFGRKRDDFAFPQQFNRRLAVG
jgi:hypothetical protein